MYSKYAEIRDKKARRENKRIKDVDVAKATKINTSTFSEWKKGTYRPKIDKIIKIASFLECSVDEILDTDSQAINV